MNADLGGMDGSRNKSTRCVPNQICRRIAHSSSGGRCGRRSSEPSVRGMHRRTLSILIGFMAKARRSARAAEQE